MFKFRLCFKTQGPFTGDEEFVEFAAGSPSQQLRLSAGLRGGKLGESKRFSLSGGPFPAAEKAEEIADMLRIAVLHYATEQRIGVDVGEHALRGLSLTERGRRLFSEQLAAPVLEDNLGITVYRPNPMPSFLGVHFELSAPKSTQAFVDAIASNLGRWRFASPKAELATTLYGVAHFETSPAARFLALFMCLEALLEPAPRGDAVRAHVDRLIKETKTAQIPCDERASLLGGLARLRDRSIAKTGQTLASDLLVGRKYDSLHPGAFFKKIYELRNALVHRGRFDPNVLHGIGGEVDRFVSDLLLEQFIEEGAPIRHRQHPTSWVTGFGRNSFQRLTLYIAAILSVAMLVFPPFHLVFDGFVQNLGHSFVFNPPRPDATVDTGMLLTQWVTVVLVARIVWLLVRDKD